MSRGPAYPYINLEAAVGLARQLYEYSKRAPANVEAVVKEKWGYSPTSSSAVKTVAALRYYGLIDSPPVDRGAESIKITERAYRILVDSPDSIERMKALKAAFLGAKAYKLCWDLWGSDMPPSMRSSLIFDHGFNESTVDGFLSNYKKSVQFAGLLGPGTPEEREQEEDMSGKNGMPEGTGIKSPAAPVEQPGIKRITAGFDVASAIGSPPAKGVGMRQEVFALAEGDVTIQWPERLSPDSMEDFTDWLRILERKIKRNVIQPEAPESRPRVKLIDDEQEADPDL